MAREPDLGLKLDALLTVAQDIRDLLRDRAGGAVPGGTAGPAPAPAPEAPAHPLNACLRGTIWPEWLAQHGDAVRAYQQLASLAAAGQAPAAHALCAFATFLNLLPRAPGAAPEALAADVQRFAEILFEAFPDASADALAFLDLAEPWAEWVNAALQRHGGKLFVRLARPGDSVDPDLMETVRSTGGNRLTVRQPLNFVVYEKGDTRPLRRARVITT